MTEEQRGHVVAAVAGVQHCLAYAWEATVAGDLGTVCSHLREAIKHLEEVLSKV